MPVKAWESILKDFKDCKTSFSLKRYNRFTNSNVSIFLLSALNPDYGNISSLKI